MSALSGGIVVVPTRAEHGERLAALQDLVFPSLAPAQRFRAEHYRKHIELFPEGQFVALDGEAVVGMTSSLRLDFDFEHPDHRFEEVIAGGFLTTHDPSGAWLYGADIGTHPEYRRRGIARALYAARHATVRALGLAGQVTVGMLSGYGARRAEMTVDEYYAKLVAGELTDPTVSAQLRVGFELRGLVRDYLDDPVCDGCGATLVLPASKDV